MRLGVSLGNLIDDVRAELGLSGDPGHGVGDQTRIRRAINRAYEEVYRRREWPMLSRTFPRVAMQAGQRFYDPPTNLKIEDIQEQRVWWNDQPYPLERGIGVAEYAMFDPESRSDPVLKFDVRYHDTPSNKAMIEVWPTPASAQCELEFVGAYNKAHLVEDSDVCLVDAECVILFAAAFAAPSAEKDARMLAAEKALIEVAARSPDLTRIRMGLGSVNKTPIGRAVVRVT